MKESQWPKRIGLILTLLLSLELIYLLLNVRQDQKQQEEVLAAQSEQYTDALRPLWTRKASLEREIVDLQNKYQADRSGSLLLFLLLTEPDERLMTDVLPMLSQYEFPGLISVSEENFIGDSGCLSKQQMIQLLEKGWEICMRADAQTDISSLYERIKKLGVVPTAVYCPTDPITAVQKLQLQSLGIKTLIYYGSDIQTEKQDGFWQLQAYGSKESNARSIYQSAMNNQEALVLTAGYQKKGEKFDSDNYNSMLSTIWTSIESGKTTIRTMEQGILFLEENERKTALMEKSYRERLQVLETELAQITEELSKII